MSRKILCVDDEPNILQAYQRSLRKQFDLHTAAGGAEGLQEVAAHGPFAVVVSDMRMPGMDGIQFLTALKQNCPNTVGMMLTGNADQETAIRAVNEGQIFRFLTKPCSPDDLAKALNAGLEQYRLIMAEHELLGKTLRGSIKVLNEVLSLSNPIAFGHASRVRDLVGLICKEMNVTHAWECEIAAMLSQIGCITIPSDTLERFCHGKTLLRSELEMIQAHPGVGRDLVAHIPRLEGVARIIAYQQKCFDGSGVPEDDVAGQEIPLGARILKAALDYDAAHWGRHNELDAVSHLVSHARWYDPAVLEALKAVVGIQESQLQSQISLRELVPGMTLCDDVRTGDGMVVVTKGQEVTQALCQRIHNFARHRRIQEPICVLVPMAETAGAGRH
jgi:response regulator RpfG family c-di-GMP phosphodiesterase